MTVVPPLRFPALRTLTVDGRAAGVPALLDALGLRLNGSGPAVLPLPAAPEQAARVLAVLRPDEPLESENVAVVVATSGSTGEPKGVLLSAGALTSSAAATATVLGGPGQWLLALPTTTIAGVQVLVRSLLAGTEPVVVDSATGFRPDAFAGAVRRLSHRRRYTALVPTQLVRLLADAAATSALRTLDAVLLGGAAASPDLLREAEAAGVPVVTTYGMSETAGGCVYDGVPLPGVRVEVDAGSRIRIAGPTLFLGYRLRPDLTAQALLDGWLVTSDRGRLAEGRLHVLGRLDDVVVTGGVNVALTEVEAVLRRHPDVREAAAVAVPDSEWGVRIVAAVVPSGAAAPADMLAELRRAVATALTPAAAPRDLLLFDTLPLLPSGKLDRRSVSARAAAQAQPDPQASAQAATQAQDRPRTQTGP